MNSNPSDSDFHDAADLLDSLEAGWVLIGGQAANRYRADVRYTEDFDFLVTTLEGLAERLEGAGYTITLQWPVGEALDGLRQIRATKDGKGFDFNLVDVPEYQLEVIERAQGNRGVAVIEDLLILKFNAWRDRDRGDIRSVLRAGRVFDQEMVRAWTEIFGTDDRLDREIAFAEICREADRKARGSQLPLEQVVFEAIYVDERAGLREAIALAAGGEVNFDRVREMLTPFGRAAAVDSFEAAVSGERRRVDSLESEHGRENGV